jgi:hypothetical protein
MTQALERAAATTTPAAESRIARCLSIETRRWRDGGRVTRSNPTINRHHKGPKGRSVTSTTPDAPAVHARAARLRSATGLKSPIPAIQKAIAAIISKPLGETTEVLYTSTGVQATAIATKGHRVAAQILVAYKARRRNPREASAVANRITYRAAFPLNGNAIVPIAA